jgi:hypothetical protein
LTKISALLLTVAAACNQPTIQTPIRSFDQPSDVALVCSQYDFGRKAFYPRALDDCSPARKKELAVETDPNTGNLIAPGLQALVVQRARGELAYVDAEAGRILDLRQAVPGFNFLYVGNLPEHVRATPDGCRAAVTNAGSCDLAVVELPVLFNLPKDPYREGGVDEGYIQSAVRRVRPTVNGRPLGARPSWIEWAPESRPGLQSGASPPTACTGGRSLAWVAFPGCQLVAEIDLDTADASNNAEIVRALRVTRDGIEPVSDLSSISCAAECAGIPVDGGLPPTPPSDDMSAIAPTDMGSTSPSDAPDLAPPPRLPMSQAFPSALALDFEGGATVGRMFISDPTSPRVWVVPLDATGSLGTPRALTLTDDALGVEVARVSPRSPAGKFLYAVARDATVRVVDLDREVECETRPDPRATISTSAGSATPIFGTAPIDPQEEARALGCLPLGDPSTPSRSSLVTSPGIALQNGALPRDVVFVHTTVQQPTDPRVQPPVAGPSLLVGDFAFILGSDGRATPVTIFDACPAPNIPQGMSGAYTPACALGNAEPSRATLPLLPGRPTPTLYERLAHRPRNGSSRYVAPASCGEVSGAPRLPNEATPFSTTIGLNRGVDTGDGGTAVLPKLLSFPEQPLNAEQCPTSQRTVGFFEWDRMRNETWSVAWEGTLPTTSRTARLAPGGLLTDAGGAFCFRGVRAGDKVVLGGCTKDADCDYAQACVRDPAAPSTVTTGLCLDRDPAKRAVEERECGPLLRGIRRYRVLSARQAPAPNLTEDTLRIVEIAQPEHPMETRTCVADADCAMVTVPVRVGGADQAAPTRCVADADGEKRCLRTCTIGDSTEAGACGVGFQCARSSVDGAGRCLRAPWDDRFVMPVGQGGFGCLREAQPYEVRAGESFLVSGSQTGMFSVLEPGPDGECRIPPARAATPYVRLRQSRIPASAPLPACFASGAPATSLLGAIVPPGDPSSNVCDATAAGNTGTRVVHFENPFVAFAIDIPQTVAPPDDLVIRFDVVGAGFPQTIALGVDVVAQTPRTGVVAPDGQTIFVVDEGKQSAATGLRGQLIRLFAPSLASDRSFIVR